MGTIRPKGKIFYTSIGLFQEKISISEEPFLMFFDANYCRKQPIKKYILKTDFLQ